jgi:hypothetical protein
MVQIGNYNYSDYYSTGAQAPREGTLSYAEFDPDAYLAVNPAVAQDPGFMGQSQYQPTSLFMRQYGRAPTRDEALYAHYQGLYPSNPQQQRPDQVGDQYATRTLTFSADQNQTYQQSEDIRLLGVPWANTRQVYQHS